MRLKQALITAITLIFLLLLSTLSYGSAMDDEFDKMVIGWFNNLAEHAPGIGMDYGNQEQEFNDIQPDYGAGGTITSECKYDEECFQCMKAHAKTARDLMIKLEKVYVIYQRTMKKYDMMVAIADGAANLGQYAKYAWMMQKGSPRSEMNVAKKKFENKYDNSQVNKLQKLNAELVAIGDCEKQHMGNPNWYNLNAVPLYTQLSIRYKR
ncbi:MAG TPA: hypothetical protein ENH40_03360 [Nitrospirae bacterium]|nr:hypothetical protein [Nitrospirota bacterium]